MKYVIIATLVKLLSAKVWSREILEVNLINRLNEFFCFDYNIFLLDSLNDHNRHIVAMDRSDGYIPPQTIYIIDDNVSVKNGTQLKQLEKLPISKNPFLIVLTAKEFIFGNDTQILDEMILIRQLNPNAKIGVFFENNTTSMEIVLQLFRRSWSHRIVNIFCAFHHLNAFEGATGPSFVAYRFDPFDATFLLNLTGSESLQNYFPDKIPNYHEQPLRFLKFYDLREFNSFELNFWHNIVRMFNASMSMKNMSGADFEELGFNFSTLNADVDALEVNLNENLKLYPYGNSQFVLLVPHSRPYANVVAYLRNTTWKTLFAYTFLVTAAASLLLTVSGYMHTNKISLLQCVVNVINLLINDNFAIKYEQLYRADVFIVVPLTFAGLIVANGILSVFKSCLTVPIYDLQIKTIDELFESGIPILSHEVYWANETIASLERLSRHTGWSGRVHPTNFFQYKKNLFEFNNSVAYSSLSGNVRWCLNAQKRLNVKAYYLIIEKFLGQYFVTFNINSDFPFIEPINVIYHDLSSGGLIDKWLKDVDEDGIKELTKSYFDRPFNSSDQSDSDIGMMAIVWCGWIAGIIVFIGELIWNKIQPQIKELKQTLWIGCTEIDSEL